MGENKVFWGLDMGTSSVGWAVTNEKYELQRAKGKDLWGARLFDEAKTSAERRGYRISRRRRQRQLARIGFLKDVFADEINKIDESFFQRLKESKYHFEDRSDSNRQKFALFNDKNFTDKEYYDKYPTIFHLRKELIESNSPKDIRLVFLALLNMFKHRGNFLSDSIDTDSEMGNLEDAYKTFVSEAGERDVLFNDVDISRVEAILSQKGVSKSVVCENLCDLFGILKKDKTEFALLSLICGKTVKLLDIYGAEIIDEEHKSFSLCFRGNGFEEKEAEIKSLIGDDNYDLIEATKQLHDIGFFANIMKGQPYLTYARVETYEEHKNDLELLKKVLRKYNHKAYNDMFRNMGADNYSAYIGSVYSHGKRQRRGSSVNSEDFYKNIKKVLSKIEVNDEDVQIILNKIDTDNFLVKQLTSANGVIPNQEYVREMKKILNNAESYLPFLKRVDETGLSVSQKIIQVFSFHMPYYVGPIGQEHLDEKGYNVWAKRIAPGKVYPWNLEEKIDTKEAAEKFIERMVRRCSYLKDQRTLPKNSLMYERFMVLNELNNLKVKGEVISVEVKQDIYNTIFMKGKKVSIKALEKYFKSKGMVSPEESDFLSGIDIEGGFKSSLSSLGKFLGVFGQDALKESYKDMIENIIFYATVYGNDKKFLKDRIIEKYGDFISEKDLKRILGFKFEGWGNLSKEFLEIEGLDKNTGEIRTIIGSLWETNDNLMQILSDAYTYQENLSNMLGEAEKDLFDWSIEDLDGMYLSSPVKRMVWQTIKIMRELETVTGKKPDRIFVEMPREKEKDGGRKDSRKKKLLDLYSSLKSEEKTWREDINNKTEAEFRIKKLYLYYIQMGKCMYTGEHIDLERLMTSNDYYDIDHIYPRHFIKDDSIENNLVLVKKTNNSRKSDTYPIDKDIQGKMLSFWKFLADKQFISKEKYQRLIRVTSFTDEERAAFVSRQIVETRQGTKAITQILKRAYPDSTIVFSKAGQVSDFRKEFDLIKVRCLNDFHHAKDAYLNIVVGNTYHVKFTSNPLNFMKEASKNSYAGDFAYHMGKIFWYDVNQKNEVAWVASRQSKPGTIDIVRKTLKKNSVLITKRAYVAHGGINAKETIYGKDKAKEGAYLPVDGSDPRLSDVTKYGGRTSIQNMCYCLASYRIDGKRVLSIEALPILLGDINSIPDEIIIEYLRTSLELEYKNKTVTDIEVKIRCIKYGTKIKIDGFYYYLAGKSEVRIKLNNAIPLTLSEKFEKYYYYLEKAIAQNDFDNPYIKDQIEKLSIGNGELFAEIINKLTTSIYKHKKNSVYNILINGKEQFDKLSREDQGRLLLQIVSWFQLACIEIDLRAIGGSYKSGTCRTSKKITDSQEVILIQESSTGLLSREINLLKI